MMLAWVVAAVVVVLLWVWQSTRRPAWAPHGPPLLPWVGNLLSMNLAKPHITYGQWARKYGGIYHVQIGVTQQIVLSDPDLIREACGRAEVTGRPDTEFFQFIVNGAGLAGSQGELWQETRRLTLFHLRNLGMGKSKLEDYMHQQITSFMDEILVPSCGSEITIDRSLNVAVVNIIWKLVASEELNLTDAKVLNSVTKTTETIQFAQIISILDSFPWLKRLMSGLLFNKARVEKVFNDVMRECFIPCIESHRADLSDTGEPRDYIEAMLREQKKRHDLIADHHLLMSVVDLFFAGNDTTATTLRWALCFLCSRPEVQRRSQAELDTVVGRQRPPSLADRTRLPYTEAMLLETQRLADIAPLSVLHQTLAPVGIGGHRVPAGVQVISNLHAVHHCERLFSEPLQFRPERFLDADGKFRPDRNVMAFSVGKRQCVGEALARGELFLFVTCLLQNFTFRWPEGFQHDFSENPKATFLREPAEYKLIPEKR